MFIDNRLPLADKEMSQFRKRILLLIRSVLFILPAFQALAEGADARSKLTGDFTDTTGAEQQDDDNHDQNEFGDT